MNDLTQLMERATDDLQPDVAGLVWRGMVRGRRLRTRRRAATGLGAVAAVAAVGTVAVFAPSFVGADSTTLAPADAPPSGRSMTAPALPSRSDLVQGRVFTLPAGSTLLQAWGSRKEGFVAAAWRYTPAGNGGPGRIEVLIERTGGVTRLERKEAPPATACHSEPGQCTKQPDGSWMSTFTAAEPLTGGGNSAIIGAHASIWTADGFHLTATSYNAMDEKHTPVTRDAPVLDEEQLGELLRHAQLG